MQITQSHFGAIHRLKQHVLIGIVCGLVTMAIWLALSSHLIAQTTDAGVTVTVVDTSAQSVTVRLDLLDYAIEKVDRDGLVYHRVQIGELPQSTDNALPQVPIHGVLVGLPTTSGVNVELLAADHQDLPGYDFMPAPVWSLDEGDFEVLGDETLVEGFQENASWNDHRGFLPAQPAMLGDTGDLRGQVVGQLQFYPVAYDPATRTARIYQSITARISWDASANSRYERRLYSPAFEPVLENALINYADLTPARSPVANVGEKSAPDRTAADVQDAAEEVVRLAKIVVDKDGLYRINYEDLVKSNVPTETLATLDPDHLTITNRGRPVAIEVQVAKEIGFGNEDTISFYGEKIQRDPFGLQNDPCGEFAQPAPDHLFTDENVYWLEINPALDNAARMETIEVEQPSDATNFPVSFSVTRHFEEDERYWQTMLSQHCADRWFWKSRIGASAGNDSSTIPSIRHYGLELEGIAADVKDSGKLTIEMAGYTRNKHPNQISIDGVPLEPVQTNQDDWEGQRPFTSTHMIASEWLTNTPTVSVEALSTGSEPNQFLVNWMRLEFNQTYTATRDLLYFANSSGGNALKLTGFSSSAIALYDITEPITPTRLIDGRIDPQAAMYGIAFVDPRPGKAGERRCQNILVDGRCYVALTPEQYGQPKSITAYRQPTLEARAAKANYVIITHPDFASAAQDLAAHRKSNELATAVVYIDDIFAEFGHGIRNPKAIRDFLEYGYQCWEEEDLACENQLEYVVFLGDANQDGRDIYGVGQNYVPTQIFESTLFGEIASDNWFALMPDATSGQDQSEIRDTLPDLFLGRIAISSTVAAQNVVDKIKTYEATEPNESWREEILYVADDEEKFRTTLKEIQKPIPGTMRVQVEETPTKAEGASALEPYYMAEKIRVEIDEGKAIVGYVGHGDYNAWGRWDAGDIENYHYIYHVDYVQLLDNAGRLPFVMVGNCLNGFFSGPIPHPAMAEVLLYAEDKGAVGAWAPTGLGLPSGHRELLTAFNNAVFNDDQRKLGPVVNSAYAATYAANAFWEEITWTFVLFGDPYMELNVPAQHRVYMPLVEKTP